MRFIEQLEPETWFRAIEALSERARRSAADIEEQLRHGYHLIQMAPLVLRDVIDPPCDEARFEQLLACEAFESAALVLIPAPLKYSAARGSDGTVLATVALPGDDTGSFASAEDCASALLQAWTQSILALRSMGSGRAKPASTSTDDFGLPRSPAGGFRKLAGN